MDDEAALRVAAAVKAVLVGGAGEGLAHRVLVPAALRRVVALVRQTGHLPGIILFALVLRGSIGARIFKEIN